MPFAKLTLKYSNIVVWGCLGSLRFVGMEYNNVVGLCFLVTGSRRVAFIHSSLLDTGYVMNVHVKEPTEMDQEATQDVQYSGKVSWCVQSE